jgi:hypothetical protein
MNSSSPETPAKANRLSHSAIKTYAECGQKYKYHYIDRIREEAKSGALFFGTALDKALEATLINPKCNEKDIFDVWWKKQVINNEDVDLCNSLLVVYALSDFDVDLLKAEDVELIKAKALELFPSDKSATWHFHYWACVARRKTKEWTDTERTFFNYCNWFSLRRKGHIMLDAHRKHILPRIKKVLFTQKKIELNNNDGDTLYGYVDAVIIWEDDTEVIIDYKTSSVEYEANAVQESSQLTIYSVGLEVGKAGFFVLRKGLLKTKTKICKVCKFDASGRRYHACPNIIDKKICGGEFEITLTSIDVDINILIEEVSEESKAKVLELIEETNKGIKAGNFERNYESCKTKYGYCPYFNLCHKNDGKGLVQV